MAVSICPNNFQGEREHKWSWCSITSFNGGRSGTYAKCHYCQAEDWAALEARKAAMPPPVFKRGDTVTYRDEHWRWDITGNERLELLKVDNDPAIVMGDFVNPMFSSFADPLERRYHIICRSDEGKIFERYALAEFLTPSVHDGTIKDWESQKPKRKPFKIEDDDPMITDPRLRSIGVQFEEQSRPYRCHNCGGMQRVGTPMAYVRDNFSVDDDWRSMVECYQRNPHNGHGSGWCPNCAHKLLPRWSKAYLKFKLTGAVPMKVYMKMVCQKCGKDVSRGRCHYRSIGEDQWEVYCHECHYALYSYDVDDGGFITLTSG